jgi:hypothetical protein
MLPLLFLRAIKDGVPWPETKHESTDFPELSSHVVVEVLPVDDTGFRGSLDGLSDLDWLFMKVAEKKLLISGGEIKRVEYSEHTRVLLLDIRVESVSQDFWSRIHRAKLL